MARGFPAHTVKHGIWDGVVRLKRRPLDVHVAIWPEGCKLVWMDHNRQAYCEPISKRVASILISKGMGFEG